MITDIYAVILNMRKHLPYLFVLALLTGCTMPKHTVGLDRLLITEGRNFGTRYTYRCTRGAHRGASEDFKENTMDALLAANSDRRYAFIEFDVQYSKDSRIVVFHDKRMFRTFGSMRKIANTTFAELQEITEDQIVELKDVMSVIKKKMNIEIKSQGDLARDMELVDEVMTIVTEHKREDDVLISSISDEVVEYVNDKYPETPTGQIFWLKSSTYIHIDGLTKGLYRKAERAGADYLMLHVSNLRNIDDLLKLKPEDKTIVFWDFDDRMYVVHKDSGDRIWGMSGTRNFFQGVRYRAASFCRRLNPWD